MNRNRILITCAVLFAFHMSPAFLGTAFGSTSSSSAFEIEIKVADVQNLYGFDLKLYYNTACLDLIEASPTPLWYPNLVLRNQINEALGMYRIALVATPPASPFDGTITLVTLTFLRTDPGEESFSLGDVYLGDQGGGAISNIVNGLVIQAVPVHDIAITRIGAAPRGVYQGDPIKIGVTIKNQGNFLEAFDVTLYADKDKTTIGDEYILGVQTVSDLPAKSSRTINFVWDTHGVAYGYYWLSAKASAVSEETDTVDNFLKCGDWIGGIYAPVRVRQMANLWINLTSTFIMAGLTLVGSVGVKKYWFP